MFDAESRFFLADCVDKIVAAIDRLTDAIIEDRKIALGLGDQARPQTPVQANIICLHCNGGPVKETTRFYLCDGCGEAWEKQPYKPPEGGNYGDQGRS